MYIDIQFFINWINYRCYKNLSFYFSKGSNHIENWRLDIKISYHRFSYFFITYILIIKFIFLLQQILILIHRISFISIIFNYNILCTSIKRKTNFITRLINLTLKHLKINHVNSSNKFLTKRLYPHTIITLNFTNIRLPSQKILQIQSCDKKN